MNIVARLAAIAALISLSIAFAAADDTVQTESAWSWGSMIKEIAGDRQSMGLTLYTNATDTRGAAFRCDRKRLYAFIAVKAVDLHEMMLRRSRNAKPWAVSYSIDQNETQREQWVTIHGGQLLMVKSEATAEKLFDAARRGTVVTIDPKYGKTVSVEIPPDTIGLFDKFWERCKL